MLVVVFNSEFFAYVTLSASIPGKLKNYLIAVGTTLNFGNKLQYVASVGSGKQHQKSNLFLSLR